MDKSKENKGVAAAAEQKEPEDSMAKQLNDYKDSLQRLQAEFENYKKRVDKEKVQFRQFAAAEVVKNFLPVLDSFELALKSIANGSNSGKIITAAADDKIARGLELIYGQFYSALEAQGLRPIKAVGEKFDPYKHEVLMQEETADEKRDGVVVEEFQKGYALNDVILRYSKVKVLKFAKASADKNTDKNDKNNVSGGK
ncbi:nucleotide exchange factor GrpE [Candidatus Woesearchaeota archaeon]|nr:nucleotide exchange factor GrpE [Candidatus Woesearchaeota archaeon]